MAGIKPLSFRRGVWGEANFFKSLSKIISITLISFCVLNTTAQQTLFTLMPSQQTGVNFTNIVPENKSLHRWLKLAKEKIAFQGLPARICWLGQGEREKAGLAFNELVRTGKVNAPIVIGRDHLDTGSVASPNRETEAMLDGSDAVADWPLLNALLNTAGGASWVSLHHGGGVGMGYSIHAGMVIVADGSDDAAARLSRVLRNDPGMGVIRHADAGYDIAIETAKKNDLYFTDRLK